MKLLKKTVGAAALALLATSALAGDSPGGMLPPHDPGTMPVFNYVVDGNTGGGTSFFAERSGDGEGSFDYEVDGWDHVRTQTWFNFEQPGTPLVSGAAGYAGSERFQRFVGSDKGTNLISNFTTGGVSSRTELWGYQPCNGTCLPTQ